MRFKKVKLPDGNIIVDTGLPQRGIKPAGLEMHTHMLKTLYAAVKEDPHNMENGVVRGLCKILVNTILDMAKRDEALENIHRLIEEELDGNGASLSFGERTRVESDIWMEIGVREMTEYLDQAFGVSHRLAIGTFGNAPEDKLVEPKPPEPKPDLEMHEEWMETEDDT